MTNNRILSLSALVLVAAFGVGCASTNDDLRAMAEAAKADAAEAKATANEAKSTADQALAKTQELEEKVRRAFGKAMLK
ncbi:MAG: alanine-zipper protein [Gammaproteobacteria bacterium]